MTQQISISASKRERAGKGAARATRREGLLPCVVYGEKKDPVMFAVDPRVIMKGLETGHFFNSIFEIDVEGKKERALPRDVQFHPVTDQPLHVDFLRVGKHTRVAVMVPVNFLNEEKCPGLKKGGILSVVRREVELFCFVDEMPDEVQCDLSSFEVGDTVHISNVTLPEGAIPTITDRDFVVANIAAPKVSAAVEEAEEEGAEEEEGGEEE